MRYEKSKAHFRAKYGTMESNDPKTGNNQSLRNGSLSRRSVSKTSYSIDNSGEWHGDIFVSLLWGAYSVTVKILDRI